jgi:hypothetical protein
MRWRFRATLCHKGTYIPTDQREFPLLPRRNAKTKYGRVTGVQKKLQNADAVVEMCNVDD